jgi:hypothetical protein
MPTHTSVPSSESERELSERFQRLVPHSVNADRHLVWRGRTLNADCLIQIGSTGFLLRIDAGRIRKCRTELPLLCSWDLAVRGSLEAWAALWQDPPPPGWHDIFALSKLGEMSFEGNLQPFLAHLQYFKDVLTFPRKRGTR